MTDINTQYREATDFLFTQFPMFQRTGASAYKPGLENAFELSAVFGNPHEGLRCIHIAGTNGKGSTAHSIAAVLQQSGYKVGLYTSPHLQDFRERIRVNGQMIDREAVVDFTNRYREMQMESHPSFFELTTIMAFEHFKRSGVDVAVIETGLGGRLDTTNIISPDMCVITNISFDHTALLGNTPDAIASEKAGIIKKGVPVVIGEAEGVVREVFAKTAEEVGAPIRFVDDIRSEIKTGRTDDGRWKFSSMRFGDVVYELSGDCQEKNGATVLTALSVLADMGYRITEKDVRAGMAAVEELTGLRGRWMVTNRCPLTVCDTGHNEGGWQYIVPRLTASPGVKHMVIGFVNDKDVSKILKMIGQIENTRLYFARASVDRALPSDALKKVAASVGLKGDAYETVGEAYEKALAESGKGDTVYVGGSTFIVADYLDYISEQR